MLRTLLLLALLARAHTHPPSKAGTEAEAAGEEEAPAPPPAPPVWFLTTVPSRFISRAPTRSPKAVQVSGALVEIHTNFIPQNVWEQERQPYPPLTLPPALDSFHAFVMPEPRPAFGGPGTLAPGDAYEPHTPFPYFTGQRTPRGRYASVADQMRRRGRLFDTSDDAPIAPYDQFRSPFNNQFRSSPNMHAIVHMDADALRTSAAARYHRHVVYVHGEAPPQGGHRMWSVTTIGDHTEALYNIVARGNLFPGHALTVADPHLTNWWRLDRLDRLYSYLEIERPPAEHSVLYDGHIPVYTAALRLCRLLTADGEWRLAAVQQLVWVNPLDIMLDPTGRRGLGFWALYRARSGYEGFFLPARSVSVHAMQPLQLHRTQPTRAGGTDLARRLVAHARPGPYELDYWLLVRMLNRLENLAYVRHNERLIGTETVYRSVDGARGLVDFGQATLTMNGDPFRDTLAAWRDADFGRHAATLL
jgi:hypothetical protein